MFLRVTKASEKSNWLLIFLLAAAGVSCSSDNGPNTEEPPVIERAPTVNPPGGLSGALTLTADISPKDFIINGLLYPTLANTRTELPAPTFDAGNAAAGSFSVTNTQEVGVDEADRIEFDGRHFFVASYPQWFDRESAPFIRVLDRADDGGLTQTSTISLAEGMQIQGLYLNTTGNNELTAISSSDQVYPVDALFSSSVFVPGNTSIAIDVFDVTDTRSPQTIGIITTQGFLLGTRKIDDALYVVSAFQPSVDGLITSAETEEQQLQNYLHLLEQPNDVLLPNVHINGSQTQLYSPDDCLIPETATENDGFAYLIQILRIDVTQPDSPQALCVAAHADYFYASPTSLYLGAVVDGVTQLHKFQLDQTFGYAASGQVPGQLGWRGSPSLRMSEHNGDLRIVTTDYEHPSENLFHRLFVLSQQDNQLTQIGSVPDAGAQQGLGKPGEDVYAVRYVGDKGYVVTFQQIDPLYVIDLSIPSQPKILGELEIPGFSSYLQPIGNDYLLGVGQQVELGDLPGNGTPIIGPPLLSQMKVSLFDVRDPQSPQELTAMLFPDAYTPVEYDYRALSVIINEDRARFGMPIESWQWREEDSAVENTLLILDIDLRDANPELRLSDALTPEAFDINHYIYAGEDRSVLVNDGAYYLRGNQLWYRPVTGGETLLGPY